MFAKSIAEVKKELNLKTVRVEWNDPFPAKELLNVNKSDNILHPRLEAFCEQMIQHGLDRSKVTRKDLVKLCALADANDLIMAYIVTEPTAIEIFCHEKVRTDAYLAEFKPLMARRLFFNMFQSLRNVKDVNDDFSLSQYYQLASPNLPFGYDAYIKKIDNDYILVSYRHDVLPPIHRIVRVTKRGFESFTPEVSFNPEVFDSITMKFDGKTYTGDSLRTLWDGTERESKDDERTLCYTYKNEFYILDSEKATVQVQSLTSDHSFDDFFDDLDHFRKTAKIDIILEVSRNDKRALLLSNACIWFVDDCSFVNLLSLEGLKTLNTELFTMSSKEKGIVISRDNNGIELVPSTIFENLIYRMM